MVKSKAGWYALNIGALAEDQEALTPELVDTVDAVLREEMDLYGLPVYEYQLVEVRQEDELSPLFIYQRMGPGWRLGDPTVEIFSTVAFQGTPKQGFAYGLSIGTKVHGFSKEDHDAKA